MLAASPPPPQTLTPRSLPRLRRSDMRASFQFQVDAQESGLQPPVAYTWSEAGGWQRVAEEASEQKEPVQEEAVVQPRAPAYAASRG